MAARHRGVERLDIETASYFSEMAQHFAQLTDPEEAALLAGNALAEVGCPVPPPATSPTPTWRIYPGCRNRTADGRGAAAGLDQAHLEHVAENVANQ